VKTVRNHWPLTVDMRAQRLSDLGYLVWKCDNRGSFNRGLRFEGQLKVRVYKRRDQGLQRERETVYRVIDARTGAAEIERD
jgi:hypothetical protein